MISLLVKTGSQPLKTDWTLREYRNEDAPAVASILRGFGVEDSKMVFDRHETYVLEGPDRIEGLYTINYKTGRPHLQHFAVAQGQTSTRAFWRLGGHWRQTMKRRGITKCFLGVRDKEIKTWLIVQKYFGVKPYSEQNMHKFYCVEV